jgi:hypothetical protein
MEFSIFLGFAGRVRLPQGAGSIVLGRSGRHTTEQLISQLKIGKGTLRRLRLGWGFISPE